MRLQSGTALSKLWRGRNKGSRVNRRGNDASARAIGRGMINADAHNDTNLNQWNPTRLLAMPAFHDLEKSSRFTNDDLPSVASRISDFARRLDMQIMYDDFATARVTLTTGEGAEKHVCL